MSVSRQGALASSAVGLMLVAGCATARPATPAPTSDPPAATPSDVIADVEAAERRYHLAVTVGDFATQLSLLADDYVLVTPFGDRLDREAVLNDSCLFEAVSLAEALQVVLAPSGQSAMVTLLATSTHTGQPALRVVRTVRVWERRPTGWVARFAQQTSLPGTPPNDDRAVAAGSGSPNATRAGRRRCGWAAGG